MRVLWRAFVVDVLRHPWVALAVWFGVPLLAWWFDVDGRLRAMGWMR